MDWAALGQESRERASALDAELATNRGPITALLSNCMQLAEDIQAQIDADVQDAGDGDGDDAQPCPVVKANRTVRAALAEDDVTPLQDSDSELSGDVKSLLASDQLTMALQLCLQVENGPMQWDSPGDSKSGQKTPADALPDHLRSQLKAWAARALRRCESLLASTSTPATEKTWLQRAPPTPAPSRPASAKPTAAGASAAPGAKGSGKGAGQDAKPLRTESMVTSAADEGPQHWWQADPRTLKKVGGASAADEELLLSAIWHLSSSRAAAWSTISHCYSAANDPKERRASNESPGRGRMRKTSEAYRLSVDMSPDDFLRFQLATSSFAAARQKSRNRMKRLASLVPPSMPQTYLQMIGQQVLYCAGRQLPAIMSLPELIPQDALWELYGRPFATAVSTAMREVLASPSRDMSPFVPTLPPTDPARQFTRIYASKQKKNGTIQAQTYSIVAVISNLYLDTQDFLRGFNAALGGLHSSLREILIARLSSTLDDIFMRMRETAGTAIQKYLAGALTHIMTRYDSTRYDDIGCEVMLDSWPAVDGEESANMGAMEQDLGAAALDSGDLDRQRPKRIDDMCHRCLSLISLNLFRVYRMPAALQAPLGLGIMQALGQLMSKLAAVRAPAKYQPSPRASFFHLADAVCVQRRLKSFRRALDMPFRDALYFRLLAVYGSCLCQADELVDSLEAHIVQMNVELLRSVCLASIDATDWAGHRPPPQRADTHGAAARLLRHQLVSLLHAMVSVCSLSAAERMFSRVMLKTASGLAVRYLQLAPREPWLPRFSADVCEISNTIFWLSQLISVEDTVVSGDQSCSEFELKQTEYTVSVTKGVAQKLEDLARAMCVRAALLSAPPEAFFARARKAMHKTLMHANALESDWDWLPDLLKAKLQDAPLTLNISKRFEPLSYMDVATQPDEEMAALWEEAFDSLLSIATLEDIKSALVRRSELLEPVPGLSVMEETELVRAQLLALAKQINLSPHGNR